MTLRAFSFGGGVQSTAVLAMQAMGELDAPYAVFLFANTGDDSEHPATLAYVREVAMPFAVKHDIELVELRRRRRDGTEETLYQRLTSPSRSIGIPVRMHDSGAPANRACTYDFKIRVIANEVKRRGATVAKPATVGLGISLDEFRRMRTDSGIPFYGLDYPLIERRMDRQDCHAAIVRAGLPIPPKSACWFCPFHTRARWQQMRKDEPALFAKSASLERLLNERRAKLGRNPVWLSSAQRPLDEAITDDGQLDLFDAGCEAGYCMV